MSAPGGAIDLRSDTVTLPPPRMREAMARATVGDDVYGEDPTVNRLEALAAELLGKEAALFTPSGTMANLLALLSHCARGAKVLVGDVSDIWLWEAGGGSVLGGVVCHPVATQPSGELDLADLEAAVGDAGDPQCAVAALVCLENTHCAAGGRVLRQAYMRSVQAFAEAGGLAVHLDGARIFNAAVALGVDVRELAEAADSVSFCLSKGLAAPVGSLLAGAGPFIRRARRLRKMLGGGMRQAGFLAAAGIFALEEMVGRLAEDHALARLLADGLSELPALEIDGRPETNVVIWRLGDPAITDAAFIRALEQEGVRVGLLGRGRIRAVTHYGIGRVEIEQAVDAARRALRRCAATPRAVRELAASRVDGG
jgi:threonine aldolase